MAATVFQTLQGCCCADLRAIMCRDKAPFMLFIETLCQPGTQSGPPAVDLARQLSGAASEPGAPRAWSEAESASVASTVLLASSQLRANAWLHPWHD